MVINSKLSVRYNSVDMFRYVCALMVVAIHTLPFKGLYPDLYFWFGQILPRMAVPFFFTTSGFFYVKSLLAGKPVFTKYMKRLLFTYSVWSIPYFFVLLSRALRAKTDLTEFFADFARGFLLEGSYFHFWYFPALIISVLAVTLFFKFGKENGVKLLFFISLPLYLIACFGSSYFAIGSRIPLISVLIRWEYFTIFRRIAATALPFFMLSYPLNKFKDRFLNAPKNISLICLIILFAGFIVEVLAVDYLNLNSDFAVTLVLLPFLYSLLVFLLRHPLDGHEKAAYNLRIASNVTYYSHPLVMLAIINGYKCIFGHTIRQTPFSFLTCVLCALISVLVLAINSKRLNKIFE